MLLPVVVVRTTTATSINKMSATEDEIQTPDVKEKKISVENDLTVGILQLLKPAVEQVDKRVLDVRYNVLKFVYKIMY